jgi:hypothetical protein
MPSKILFRWSIATARRCWATGNEEHPASCGKKSEKYPELPSPHAAPAWQNRRLFWHAVTGAWVADLARMARDAAPGSSPSYGTNGEMRCWGDAKARRCMPSWAANRAWSDNAGHARPNRAGMRQRCEVGSEKQRGIQGPFFREFVMANPLACPHPDQLHAIALGVLPGSGADDLLAHLEQCASWATRMSAIVAEDPLVEAVRAKQDADNNLDRQAVSGLVDKVRARSSTITSSIFTRSAKTAESGS